MINSFKHQHTAHCESGVVSSLFLHHGITLTEPMVFGLASALTFAYLPIVKVSGMPLIAYRMPPKTIIKNTCKQLGIRLQMSRFSSPQDGMAALDRALEQNQLVGLQTSIFWLPYIPEALRFHFNAHNILVYGKQGDNYLISDPVLETPVLCHKDDLEKARFAKGALAGKGLMYHIDPQTINQDIDLKPIIPEVLLRNVRNMQTPLPFVGVKGIRYLAKNISKLKTSSKDDNYKKLYLGHIIRMQEEIGTGGAGFRYMYASFLQQSAQLFDSDFAGLLLQASEMMTNTGDLWRKFASRTVKLCRNLNNAGYDEVTELLLDVANEEHKNWHHIHSIAKQYK